MAKKKQPDLPKMEGEGVARKEIPRIEKQAEKVSSLCEKRKALAEQERLEREALLVMLDEEKLTTYRLDDGRTVYISDKRKALIKSSDEPDED
jgi:hypothetical protein